VVAAAREPRQPLLRVPRSDVEVAAGDREAEVAVARAADGELRPDGHALAGPEAPVRDEARAAAVRMRLQ
jgi:hypothetical protein